MTRPARLSAWLAAALALAGPAAAPAKGGAYKDSPHGNPQSGVARVPGLARGECAHCHGAPRDLGGRKDEGTGHARLFSLNDNSLCLGCHRKASGAWLGERPYAQSSHGASPAAVWPGPEPRGRGTGDAGKCLNCHDPHGVRDAAGVIPSHLRLRGAALCLGCHGGAAGPDVASDFAKTYRHPLVAPVRPPSAIAPGSSPPPTPKTGTCGGCHNAHAAAPDRGLAGGAVPGLLGVARVRISNGPAGSAPQRTPVEAGDLAAVREYEVCFACHGGSSPALARSPDVSTALNPANASFHPVEAVGRTPGIDRRAFANRWSAERQVACSDCHGSDDGLLRGPHGSRWPHLLRRRAPTRGPGQQPQETDLCFECHAWKTYGDPLAGPERAFSRFPGHATHAARGDACWTCHEAHGSATLPSLLALRSPGLVTYAQDRTGGTCTSSCHVTTPASTSYRTGTPR